MYCSALKEELTLLFKKIEDLLRLFDNTFLKTVLVVKILQFCSVDVLTKDYVMFNASLRTFFVLTMTVLAFQAHAETGRITKVKSCSSSGCTSSKEKLDDTSCIVTQTTKSGSLTFANGRMDRVASNGDFDGVLSVPAARIHQKSFKAGIINDSAVNGVAHNSLGRLIGEWEGSRNEKTGKVNFSVFWIRGSVKSGSYLEYECRL